MPTLVLLVAAKPCIGRFEFQPKLSPHPASDGLGKVKMRMICEILGVSNLRLRHF
jgi:hypothetical protein